MIIRERTLQRQRSGSDAGGLRLECQNVLSKDEAVFLVYALTRGTEGFFIIAMRGNAERQEQVVFGGSGILEI